MDRRTVAKRIRDSGIPPAGTRNGYDVYQLARVAPALLGFIAADATVVDPRDLPPIERRAYYQSENERLEAEQTLGLLVPAAEVEADGGPVHGDASGCARARLLAGAGERHEGAGRV